VNGHRCDLDGGEAPRLGAGPAAEQMFVHGLLSHLHEGPGDAMASRLAAALAATDPATPLRGRSRRPSLAAAAVAAAVALALVLWWALQPSSEQVLLADVRRLIAASEEDVDRTYRLRIGKGDERMWEGTLTVRGDRRSLVELPLPGPGPGRLVMGFDGEDSWIVPPRPRAPVRVSPGMRRPGDLGRGDGPGPDLPFFTLTRMLRRLDDGGFTIDRESRASEVVLRARRDTSDGDGPIRIEAAFDPRTGKARSVRATWPPWRGDSGPPTQVEVLWVSDAPRDDAVYRHQSHHRPGRPVVRVQ